MIGKFLWSTVGKKVCKWLVIHFPSRKLFTRYSRKLFTRQAVSYSLGRPKTGQFILNMLFIVGRFLVSLYSMYARTLYYIHENER